MKCKMKNTVSKFTIASDNKHFHTHILHFKSHSEITTIFKHCAGWLSFSHISIESKEN